MWAGGRNRSIASTQKEINLLQLLKKRNFALLWIARFISTIGDMVLYTALPFFVYNLTGSTLATGMAFVIETVPRVVLGPIAGVLVDRWDRRKILITIDIIRGITLFSLFLVKTVEDLWILYIFLFVHACVSMFYGPAINALTPRLVKKEELMKANSLIQLMGSLSVLIGPPLGGSLLGLVGLQSVVTIDIVSFIFSASLVWMIKIAKDKAEEGETDKQEDETEITGEEPAKKEDQPLKSSLEKFWLEFRDGLQIIKDNNIIREIFIVMGIYSIGQGIVGVILIPFVKDVLNADAVQYGWICMGEGIGGLLGSYLLSKTDGSVDPRYILVFAPIILGGLLGTMAMLGTISWALIIMALLGMVFIIWNVSVRTLMQLNLENFQMGRIFGIMASISSLSVLIGILISSILGDKLGPVNMVYITSTIFFISGGVGIIVVKDLMGGGNGE